MNNILEQAKLALQSGETEEAIRTIESYLKSEHVPTELPVHIEEQLIILSGNYRTLKRNEILGTVSHDEARVDLARINQSVLRLIKDLEQGTEGSFQSTPVNKKAQTKRYLFAAGLTLIALAFGLWFMQKNRNAAKCPVFEKEHRIKVAVWPFTNIGDRQAKPEEVLVSTISELTKKNNLDVGTAIFAGGAEKGNMPDEAQKTLVNCGIDLAIAGKYLVLSNDSIEVSLTYRFAKEMKVEEVPFASFRNVAAINHGSMQRSIKDAIFSLCTLLAVREKDMKLAEKWLNKIEKPQDWEQAMRDEIASTQKKAD